MSAPTLTCAWPSADAFLSAWDAELSKGGLLVRGASVGSLPAMSACQLSVQVASLTPVVVPARVAAIVPGVGVAVMFEGVPATLQALAEKVRAGPRPEAAPLEAEVVEAEVEEPHAGPPAALSERLKALTAQQKMALALSGSRDERTALLRDPIKVLHVYVLKNPRLGLDEVLNAAKNPNLSPDALRMIADNREWSGSGQVCTALVRNPRTPLPIALQLIERLPASEVRTLAKGGAREQIVHAARRKVNG